MGHFRTEAEVSDYKRVASSFEYFLTTHVWLRDSGGTRFEPWPWQMRLARVWIRERRVIILKARQMGISWMAAAYALWVGMTQPGALVLLVSQTETDAHELLDRVRFVFEHLPQHLQPSVGEDNRSVLAFPGLASEIRALPSTERAGRGRTARLVVADEHAFHQWAEANFSALTPTMEAGGQFLMVSTANGIGNLFADLWTKAGQPGSEWHRVFLGYSLLPGRDAEWYERQAATYPRSWMVHQEYPRDPEEAFVQTGRPVFAWEYLQKHKLLCREPLTQDAWPKRETAQRMTLTLEGMKPDELRVFDAPVRGHRYLGGADVAEGLEHGDYSDLSVFDADAPEGGPVEVLSLHGHWPPDEFAVLLDRVARMYPGLYGIERNNHGLAVIVTSRRLGTPGLYRERSVLNKQGIVIEPGKLGWVTSPTTKPLMIDELEQSLRTFGVRLSDALAIPELTFYQNLADGSTGAPPGNWDDRVISRAIAVQMRKALPARVTHLRQEAPVGTFAPSMRQNL